MDDLEAVEHMVRPAWCWEIQGVRGKEGVEKVCWVGFGNVGRGRVDDLDTAEHMVMRKLNDVAVKGSKC